MSIEHPFIPQHRLDPAWIDAVAKAFTTSDPPANRTRRIARSHRILAIAVIVVTLIAVPTLGVALGLIDLTPLSNTPKQPVDTSTLDHDSLALLDYTLGPGASVTRIGGNGHLAYFISVSATGKQCLFSGPDTGARRKRSASVGSMSCPHRAADYPSLVPLVEIPIRNETGGAAEGRGCTLWLRLAGLAAGGISTVSVEDAKGAKVATSNVIDHVYETGEFTASPTIGSLHLVARDTSGAERYTEPVIDRPFCADGPLALDRWKTEMKGSWIIDR